MIKIMYKHIDKLHFIIQIKVKRKMRNSLFFTYTTFLLIYISTEF